MFRMFLSLHCLFSLNKVPKLLNILSDFLEEYTAMLVRCKYLLGDVVMYDTLTPMTDCQDIASSSH